MGLTLKNGSQLNVFVNEYTRWRNDPVIKANVVNAMIANATASS